MKTIPPAKADATVRVERHGDVEAGAGQAASRIDEISGLGVPNDEMTPKVRAVLTTLISDRRALRNELAESRARISELEGLADRDPLLDILNRRAFTRELDRALAMIDRYGTPVSLLFIDLNDLKKINDQHGHAAGDAALAHVGDVLAGNVRQTDIVARLGGDEFSVLLIEADAAVAAVKGREVASLVMETAVSWRGGAFHVGVSWGAAEIEKGLSAQEAIGLADTAMYAAKKRK